MHRRNNFFKLTPQFVFRHLNEQNEALFHDFICTNVEFQDFSGPENTNINFRTFQYPWETCIYTDSHI